MQKIEITTNEANQRLDRFLRKLMKDESLSNIYKMLRKKRVTVNGKRTDENYRLIEGDVVEIHLEGGGRKHEIVKKAGMDFTITYEDENIIIVDKPPGLILHPDNLHRENTLVDQVLYYLFQSSQYDPINNATFRPASINRLDLNTGGLVIFAKNYASLMTLNEMMRERLIDKYYICIIKGTLEKEIEVEAFHTKDLEANKVSISYDEDVGSKAIKTRFIPLKSCGGYTLTEVNLITGRSHQIRAQLSSMGNPIIGDVKYGDFNVNKRFHKAYKLRGQFLYAYRVSFKGALENLKYLEGTSFKASLPESYMRIIERIFGHME